jgi:hypothetical protein
MKESLIDALAECEFIKLAESSSSSLLKPCIGRTEKLAFVNSAEVCRN